MHKNVLLVVLLFGYLLAGRIGIMAHQDPAEMDTTAYLEAAHEVRQTGGVLSHIQNSLSGVYKEATQHPLYLLALSPKAQRSLEFFVDAKKITFLIGLIFLAVVFAVIRQLFGVDIALVAVCLILLNATFIHLSTMVAAEALFALCFVLFWFFAVLGFEKRSHWLWAGVFASLAFLSKSLGILCLPIFIVSVLAASPAKILERIKSKEFWAFFVLFFLVASPLLIRNIKVFGTPFYSDSRAVLWLDRWHDYLRPDIHENPPTARSYLQSHKPTELWKIFREGLLVRDVKMLVDGLKPFAVWKNPIALKTLQGFHEKTVSWQVPWAVAIAVFFGLGIWFRRGHPAVTVSLASLAFFLVFVGWFSKIFPGAPPTRLLYPVLFLILFLAAAGIQRLLGKNTIFVTAFFAVFYLFSLTQHFDWGKADLRKSYRFNPLITYQLNWAGRNLGQSDKLLAGTNLASNVFYFPAIRGEVIEWPTFDSMEDLGQYVEKNRIRYAILDLPTVAYNTRIYGAYYEIGQKIGMIQTRPLPAFFKPLPRDPALPPLVEFYEFEGAV